MVGRFPQGHTSIGNPITTFDEGGFPEYLLKSVPNYQLPDCPKPPNPPVCPGRCSRRSSRRPRPCRPRGGP